MVKSSRPTEKQQMLELARDFPYESRLEFLTNLAHKHWEERGGPIGSPDVDWFAAEQAVYASLVASGAITQPSDDPEEIRKEVYRWIHRRSEE